ncbi:MAG TPA: DUF167 domain-containing protein [Deltaproteobacteria bacterium]|nr:DUF167 domain-containing protein [Deltaproteobacteria bacterium]HQI80419.1 DUF167 domain-containing protein [Deltaproteobacteria bacterium]
MWCEGRAGSTLLNLRVQPNASREGAGDVRNDALIIRLNAPAIEGRANEALIKFLSKRLSVAKSRIRILQGERGRNKLVEIDGACPEDVAMALTGQSMTLTPR